MAKRTGLTDPPIEALLERVESKFTLVTVAARRARQINSYYQGLGDNLGAMIPPQVASVSSKPLSVALEEIVADKINHAKRVEVAIAALAPVAAAAAAPAAPFEAAPAVAAEVLAAVADVVPGVADAPVAVEGPVDDAPAAE
jgi:DNA-directed RNA polymerase subunit omega